MRNFMSKRAGAGIRKAKTLALSVFFNIWLQLSGLVYSAFTVLFISKEYWGDYSKIIISISFFLVLCNWGSREFLTTSRNPDFRHSVAENLFKRIALLLLSVILIAYTFRDHPMFSALFLCLRFINNSFEIVIYKERKFRGVIIFEMIAAFLFITALYLFKEIVAQNFSYFLLIFLCIECTRTLIYSLALNMKLNKFSSAVSFYEELKDSFPFFINSLSGYYASRIDSLLAIFYFNSTQMATYQIMFNFVFLFQGLSNYIFYTYAFHFYRLTERVKRRVIKKYILLGTFIAIIFLAVINVLFKTWYMITIGNGTYILLSAFVLLSFLHQPYIYLIYQNRKAIYISYVGFASMVIFGTFLVSFNYLFTGSLFNNFILSAFIGQCFRSASFYILGNRFLQPQADKLAL
jgi:hypothetical protein